jgi:seryl-tRNA synthetase
MHDIKEIRRDPDAYARRLGRRGDAAILAPVLDLDRRRRELITRADGLRNEKAKAEQGMRTVDKKSSEFEAFRDQMRAVSAEIKALEDERDAIDRQLDDILLTLPNVPDDEAPEGRSEHDNVVARVWGEKPSFDFPPKEHWELGEKLGILDFERAAKLSGARFVAYKKAGARLERALMAFMLDTHTEKNGYTEVLPPFLVNAASMLGTGQFPKFRADAFEAKEDDLVLVPTAEVPLVNLHRDEILPAEALPIRYTAYTPCFRREAGGYGRDTRGLIRMHQFQKVELVQFTTPETSRAAHEALTRHAEGILQALGLHYRVIDLCTGDMGFGSNRTYDLEVWLPGQDRYREISSCSNCGDFQARRAAIRYRDPETGKPRLVHTLNGSGLAIGRTVVAILENYQQADGSVRVPEALRPYMGGVETISA